MNTYETPSRVATVLARWAPNAPSYILDPAVGNGALLLPVLKRIEKKTTAFCFDIDGRMLAQAKDKLSTYENVLIRGFSRSFLLDNSMERDFTNTIDCVVMNPPYSGRNEDLVPVIRNAANSDKSERVEFVPVEAAFVHKSLRLLRPGGRLLSILPSSIISGRKLYWLRKALVDSGEIKCVHELPHRAFSTVDGLLYLLVFEKGGATRKISVRNHRLFRPDHLAVDPIGIGPEYRLDFRFHSADAQCQALRTSRPKMKWCALRDVAAISRGLHDSPVENWVLHTTNYQDGFWSTGRARSKRQKLGVRRTSRRDIYMARVGRSCALTFGVGTVGDANRLSDCVLRIRCGNRTKLGALLFALRCIYSCDVGQERLLRGGGAKYVVAEDLKQIEIPLELSEAYPKLYARYERALRNKDFSIMLRIENRVRQFLQLRASCATSNS